MVSHNDFLSLSLSLSYSHTYTHFGLFKIWLDALCDCHCCYYDYYQNLNMMLFSLSVFCILSSVCIFFVLYYFFAAMLYTSNTHTRHFRLISNLNFAFMRCSIKFAIDIELFEQEAWKGGEILGWVQSWKHMCVAFFGLIFIRFHGTSCLLLILLIHHTFDMKYWKTSATHFPLS